MKTEAPPQPTLSRRLDELIRTPVEIDESRHTRSLLAALLQDAVRGNVSDIHLDPLHDGYELRFCIDGALMDIRHLEPSDGQHIVRAFKSTSLAEIQTVGGVGYHALRSESGASSPDQVTEHATSTTN